MGPTLWILAGIILGVALTCGIQALFRVRGLPSVPYTPSSRPWRSTGARSVPYDDPPPSPSTFLNWDALGGSLVEPDPWETPPDDADPQAR